MGMRNWWLPAGRIFGVEIRIHLTFVLLLLFIFADAVGPSFPRSVAVAGIVFGSVILHELGHALTARKAGLPPRSIVLLPLGGVTIIDDPLDPKANPARDACIAATGPLVSITVALIAGAIIWFGFPRVDLFGRPWITTHNLPRTFAWVNAFLGVFNLLPAYPMDGGRALRAYFTARLDPLSATRRAVIIGQAFAMVFILTGFGMMVSSNKLGSWFILIGFFLFTAGQLEDRSAVLRAILDNVRMGEVMITDFRTLSPADTLEDALRVATDYVQEDFPVVRGGDMVGVISKRSIVEALRQDGNGYVQPVMNKMFEVAGRHDTLAAVFHKIAGRGLSIIPVVDAGHLVGIVTLQNLMRSIAALAQSKRLHIQNQTQ